MTEMLPPAPSGMTTGLPRGATVPIYRNPAGFVFHHSGGSTLDALVTTLRNRRLGSEYLMDRDGTIYSFAPPGSSHIQPNDKWGGRAPGLSNANALGMEVVAQDDRDITPAQIAAAKRFIAKNYPNVPVYGHGEVNPGHKQATEGLTIADTIRSARRSGTLQEPGDEAPGPPPQFAASPRPTRPSTGGSDDQIKTIANQIGVPPILMQTIMERESGGNPNAIGQPVASLGGERARGAMQIMPSTFRLYASRIEQLTGRPADINNPVDNLYAGALHLRDDLDATDGNINAAARRYTGGPDLRRHGPRTIAYGNDIESQLASSILG